MTATPVTVDALQNTCQAGGLDDATRLERN
jgi:hypothetical protein